MLGRRIYDQATREALIVVWEASDRICGKRLHPLVSSLASAMERHGHDDRYDKGSLLITSQVPVCRWHEVIGD